MMTSTEIVSQLKDLFSRLPLQGDCHDHVVVAEHRQTRGGRYCVVAGQFDAFSLFEVVPRRGIRMSNFRVGCTNRTVYFAFGHWNFQLLGQNVLVVEKNIRYRRPKQGRCPGRVFKYQFIFPDPPCL
jgi:hypothetical protein